MGLLSTSMVSSEKVCSGLYFCGELAVASTYVVSLQWPLLLWGACSGLYLCGELAVASTSVVS